MTRALLLACCLWAIGAQAITVTDDRKQVVHFAAPPQRIVSLLPSLTESICVLQRCALLVGRDRYSNWPVSVQPLPQVGGGMDPNIEAIVALRPDVVLMSLNHGAIARLQALGVKVVALETQNHADVRRVLRVLGTLLALPPAQGAERVWREMEAEMTAAAQSLPQRARGVRVYFETSLGPWVAAPTSFIGETLTRLGAGNVAPADAGPFPRLSTEFVLRAQPDVLMLINPHAPAAQLYPGWQQLTAVQHGRVCAFHAAQADVLVRPGPRMGEAAHIMAKCLRRLFS